MSFILLGCSEFYNFCRELGLSTCNIDLKSTLLGRIENANLVSPKVGSIAVSRNENLRLEHIVRQCHEILEVYCAKGSIALILSNIFRSQSSGPFRLEMSCYFIKLVKLRH